MLPQLEQHFSIDQLLVAEIANELILAAVVALLVHPQRERKLVVVLHITDPFCCLHELLVQIQLAKRDDKLLANVSNCDPVAVLLDNLLWVVEVIDVLHQDVYIIGVAVRFFD